jgi:hypothetical protein
MPRTMRGAHADDLTDKCASNDALSRMRDLDGDENLVGVCASCPGASPRRRRSSTTEEAPMTSRLTVSYADCDGVGLRRHQRFLFVQ